MDKNRFKQLLESTMGNVKPLIMEQPTGGTQTNTMITDIKKFANDNGYLARNNDTTFYKKFTKFQVFLMVYQNGDVELCVSNNTKAANECDVNNTTFKNTNWNLDTFTSTVKQYMV